MISSLLAKYVSAQPGKLSACMQPSQSAPLVRISGLIRPRPVIVGHLTSDLCLLRTAADPYVKVWLMHKDKRVEKKKTVTMKRCLNPVFNESFPFDVPAHVLRETTIIITVMDKDRLSRNDVIGKASPNIPNLIYDPSEASLGGVQVAAETLV